MEIYIMKAQSGAMVAKAKFQPILPNQHAVYNR